MTNSVDTDQTPQCGVWSGSKLFVMAYICPNIYSKHSTFFEKAFSSTLFIQDKGVAFHTCFEYLISKYKVLNV